MDKRALAAGATGRGKPAAGYGGQGDGLDARMTAFASAVARLRGQLVEGDQAGSDRWSARIIEHHAKGWYVVDRSGEAGPVFNPA
ncbi:MAG: hypothetical protein AB1431_03140 [Pseudomonadota bacterium]